MSTATPTKPKGAKAARDVDAARHDWRPELFELPLERILAPVPGSNVRGAPVPDDLEELAASIKAHGIISPIRVEEAGPGEDGQVRYALVYGQRRLAAAKLAGLSTIPAIVDVHNRTALDLTVAQLVENLQREDLNPLEEAKAYRQLLDAGLKQADIAKRLGRAPSTIAHALRLLKLAEPVQEKIAAGELTASHAKAIASLPAGEQTELARRVVEHGASAHQVEDEIRMAQGRASVEDRRRDAARARHQELLAGWIALLLKKKANPETTTLVGWAGIPADGLKALAERGWERSQSAARGADQTWWAPAPKGFCDCDAHELTYRIDWRASGEVYHPQVHPACIVKEHQAAADKAEREKLETQQAEQRETERKAAEERAAALAPLATAVTTPIPPTKAKLLLFALLGRGDNGYWTANQWASRGLRYDGWRDQLWEAIDALPHERLLTEIAQLVAAAAVEAGGKVRDAIDELASPAPKPAKKGGKKARANGGQ